MSSIVLASRNRIRTAQIVAALCGTALWAQVPDAERINKLERQVAEQKRAMNDWGGLLRYGSENTEIAAPAPGEQRVIFLGDQITEFWNRGKVPFFTGKPWLNRGIAGQTTDQMLIRFRQDVVSLHPSVVIILAGLNDIAGVHGPVTEETILDNLISMSDLAHASGIRIVLASVLPVCDCAGRESLRAHIQELNELIQEQCARRGAVFLDYYSAMVNNLDLKRDLSGDGVVPNDAGYRLMATLAEKAIAEALNK
jgi:lysophospholipase L1-like esterase